MSHQGLVVAIAVSPFVCVTIMGLYLQLQGWQIYRCIGNYSIGSVTFFMQLEYPGVNFPGPNVLEAQLAAQPADLQAQVQTLRRRMRYLRWGAVLSVGFFFTALFLGQKLSS